jgi:hypothetical protein
MAGKIVADTLEHSTAGSIATNYVVNGSAKAAYGLNMSTSTYRGIAPSTMSSENLNISSFSDDGTGAATIAITSAFANAQHIDATGGQANNTTACIGQNTTASSFQVVMRVAHSNATIDHVGYGVSLGDLA